MIAPGWTKDDAVSGQVPCSGTAGQHLTAPYGVRPADEIGAMSAFAGLVAADRQALADWLVRQAPAHIDAVRDLSARPWNLAGIGPIIGIFEPGKPLASWLIAHHAQGWLVVRPSDGSMADPAATLADALGLLRPWHG
jgi:hypothetical protein